MKYPKGGHNIIYVASLVYQLLYFKKGDKKLALNIYRDDNKFSSSFFKFEASPEQMEYLDILSEGRSSSINYMNLEKELKQKLMEYEIDDLINQTAENLFEFVQIEVKKLSKNIRNFFEGFVYEHDLYMKYFDYINRYSNLILFE